MEEIKAIVEAVVSQLLKDTQSSFPFDRTTISGGVTLLKTKTVKPAPFDVKGQKIPGVYASDILTLDESPNLGVAVMEMDHTEFPWTLKYDEVDYIVEGVLEIEIDGQTVRGTTGDMIYIPKNSSIKFRTPSKTRFVCVMYPANWTEL
ncbi:MAG: cupin domain-containing protein [Treponemataceae bacterium]